MFNQEEQQLEQDHIQELYYIIPIDNLKSILENGILSHKRAERLKLPESIDGGGEAAEDIVEHTAESTDGGGAAAEGTPKKGARVDISDPEVQDIRSRKKILRSSATKKQLTIHQHANFYLQPHNAMLFVLTHKRDDSGKWVDDLERAKELCVLRIRNEIFDRGDGILTDRNAAVGGVNFFKAAEWHLSKSDSEVIAARSSVGTYKYKKDVDFEGNKKIRQAEALFPYEVPSCFIGGVFFPFEDSKRVGDKIIKEVGRTDITTEVRSNLFMLKRRDSKLEPFALLPSCSETIPLDYEEPESSASESDDDDSPPKPIAMAL